MMELPDTVELRRRRRFLMGGSLLCGAFAVGGVLVGVSDSDRFAYLIATFFRVCAFGWAVRLLTHPDVLSRLSASHFFWIAHGGASAQTAKTQVQATEKPIPSKPELPSSTIGVWDSELDRRP